MHFNSAGYSLLSDPKPTPKKEKIDDVHAMPDASTPPHRTPNEQHNPTSIYTVPGAAVCSSPAFLLTFFTLLCVLTCTFLYL